MCVVERCLLRIGLLPSSEEESECMRADGEGNENGKLFDRLPPIATPTISGTRAPLLVGTKMTAALSGSATLKWVSTEKRE